MQKKWANVPNFCPISFAVKSQISSDMFHVKRGVGLKTCLAHHLLHNWRSFMYTQLGDWKVTLSKSFHWFQYISWIKISLKLIGKAWHTLFTRQHYGPIVWTSEQKSWEFTITVFGNHLNRYKWIIMQLKKFFYSRVKHLMQNLPLSRKMHEYWKLFYNTYFSTA